MAVIVGVVVVPIVVTNYSYSNNSSGISGDLFPNSIKSVNMRPFLNSSIDVLLCLLGYINFKYTLHIMAQLRKAIYFYQPHPKFIKETISHLLHPFLFFQMFAKKA